MAKPNPAVANKAPSPADEVERLKSELRFARAKITELEARLDIDPLLDILNRRGFERELKRSLAYVKRYGTDAVLIYLEAGLAVFKIEPIERSRYLIASASPVSVEFEHANEQWVADALQELFSRIEMGGGR